MVDGGGGEALSQPGEVSPLELLCSQLRQPERAQRGLQTSGLAPVAADRSRLKHGHLVLDVPVQELGDRGRIAGQRGCPLSTSDTNLARADCAWRLLPLNVRVTWTSRPAPSRPVNTRRRQVPGVRSSMVPRTARGCSPEVVRTLWMNECATLVQL